MGKRRSRGLRRGVLAALALWPLPAFAWGSLGHRTVAETAALLVEDDLPATWGPLVARHRFELGVYAFLPDALFRHIDGNGGKTEAPTHFVNLDAKPGETAGAVDRRVAQFLDRAAATLRPVKAPRGGYVRGATAEGEAGAIYRGLVELGIMSHYSGDAAMPYHATADWNGYGEGEGGIHFYFENACVEAFEPGLAADVLAAARKNRARWLAGWNAGTASTPQLVRAVLRDSLAAVATVADLDKAGAVIALAPAGSKTDAKRKPAPEGCASMRPILVERLAKGAALTAYLWETALPKDVDFAGAANLQFSDMETRPGYVLPK